MPKTEKYTFRTVVVVSKMNGAETKEMTMETSKMVVETEYKGERDKAIDTNVKMDSENNPMELEIFVKLANPNHSLNQNGQISSDDLDPFGPRCGPHSNCPCSVHSKLTINHNSENQVVTNSLGNKQLGCGKVQNTDIQTISAGPLGNRNTGDISSDKPSLQNGDDNQSSLTSLTNELDPCHRVTLYAEDKGPKLHPVNDNLVTPPIITKNLTEAFKFLPIFGRPKNTVELPAFQNAKVREYVGCDLSDKEFSELAEFCSPDHLRTGNELKMSCRYPTQEPLPDHVLKSQQISELGQNLCLVKKLKLRAHKDKKHTYNKKLMYRGLKLLPLPQNEDYKISFSRPLEPGKELVFRVRVYRPFNCNSKERNNSRHSIFSNDIVLLGRQKLTALRERLACANDVGMRLEVSHSPDDQPVTCAKDVFPSGFLFINNAFYVDSRPGCKDHSAPVRQWAADQRLGHFPKHDMTQVCLDQLVVRLGHPEVYVHQGNCEHLFTFSEVRLLNATDPLRESMYPYHTAIAQNQTIYCTTCAEFGAKWIVTGCPRVPFDPAFFCDTCFRLYLYKDGQKICDFKAYCYRGNEINLLKPV